MQEVRVSNIRNDEHNRVRHKGIYNDTITAGQTKNMDWKIDQLQYNGVNKPSVMVGVKFHVEGGNIGDTVDFCVVDLDNILGYGAGFEVDKFADGFYIFPGETAVLKEHAAKLIKDLYIRAHYNNTGAEDAQFTCNLLRYMDTSG